MTSIGSSFYVIRPCIDMLEEPKQGSKPVSSAYYSESVKIVEESGDWVKIETIVDGYRGWTKKKRISDGTTTFLLDSSCTVAKVNSMGANLYDKDCAKAGFRFKLPFESRLEVIDPKEKASTSKWIKVSLPDGLVGYVLRGTVILNPGLITRSEMCQLSEQFLNILYSWAGRSSFGYDCSGFVQMLYRQMGIFLPRDAKDQVKYEGFREIEEKDLIPGDLIFFGLEQDKVCHEGIYLGDNLFIHSDVSESQPWIRTSSLTSPEWNGSGRLCFRAFRTLKQ